MIIHFYRYASNNFTVESDLPSGRSVKKFVFSIKNNLGDPDTRALVLSSITTALTSDGQITDDGSTSNLAVGTFIFPNNTMSDEKAGIYKWSVKAILDDDEVQLIKELTGNLYLHDSGSEIVS